MSKFIDSFKSKLESLRKNQKKEEDMLQPSEDDSEEAKDSTDEIKAEGQSAEDAGSDTDVEVPEEISDENKARMLKRKYIMLGGGACSVFIVFMVLSNLMSNSSMDQAKDPSLDSATMTAANSAGKNHDPANGIPSKYSDIAKYSQSNSKNSSTKKDAQKLEPKHNGDSSDSTNTYSNYPYSSSGSATSSAPTPRRVETASAGPATSDGGPAYYPGSNVGGGSVVSEADRAAAQAEKERLTQEKNAINSAIAFSLASNPTVQSKGGASASTSNNVSRSIPVSSYSMTNSFADNGNADGAYAAQYALQAGSVIQATLITGITTDMPGSDVYAQVRQNIYDSQTGEHLLIPQGSRLIGVTGNAGSRGNPRVGVTFKRLIYPDGRSIDLPDQKAIDGVGYAGLKDQYTEHTGKLYSTAFMTALLSAAAQSATGDSSGSDDRSPGQEAVSGAVADVLDSMKTIIDRQGQVQPTATIRPGTEFSVLINQDLFLVEYEDE